MKNIIKIILLSVTLFAAPHAVQASPLHGALDRAVFGLQDLFTPDRDFEVRRGFGFGSRRGFGMNFGGSGKKGTTTSSSGTTSNSGTAAGTAGAAGAAGTAASGTAAAGAAKTGAAGRAPFLGGFLGSLGMMGLMMMGASLLGGGFLIYLLIAFLVPMLIARFAQNRQQDQLQTAKLDQDELFTQDSQEKPEPEQPNQRRF